jgi:hypothetical protein
LAFVGKLFILNVLDDRWLLDVRDEKGLVDGVADEGEDVLLGDGLVLDDFVQVVYLLEIVFELTGFGRGDVFVDLDLFEVAELGVLDVYVVFTLVLDELNVLLLLYFLLITRVDKLDLISLIDEEKLDELILLLCVVYIVK